MAAFLTDVGRAIITARLVGNTQPIPQYIGHGTGAGSASAGSTALSTEATYTGYSRATGTATQVTTSVTDDTQQVVGVVPGPSSGGPVTITNVGIFDAATVGNLFTIADGQNITLNDGDSIQWTGKIQFT